VSEPSKTQLAVALRYEAPNAPRVVASGRGAAGDAIVKAARENGVPLDHNPALAEALSQVELDTEIPEDLYRAVAAVIGFVLRASGQIKAETARPLPRPPR